MTADFNDNQAKSAFHLTNDASLVHKQKRMKVATVGVGVGRAVVPTLAALVFRYACSKCPEVGSPTRVN